MRYFACWGKRQNKPSWQRVLPLLIIYCWLKIWTIIWIHEWDQWIGLEILIAVTLFKLKKIVQWMKSYHKLSLIIQTWWIQNKILVCEYVQWTRLGILSDSLFLNLKIRPVVQKLSSIGSEDPDLVDPDPMDPGHNLDPWVGPMDRAWNFEWFTFLKFKNPSRGSKVISN